MRFDLGRLRSALQQRANSTLTGTTNAAVAAILRPSATGTEALLIQRTRHIDDPWSGHMAFPGGRQDVGDASLLATATRETLEEIGVDLARDAELLGPLAALDAVARGQRVGFTISPFVFSLLRPVELRLDTEEVEAVVWAPLDSFALGERNTTWRYEHGNARYDYPGFDLDGRVVWGLTYRILLDLIKTAGDAS
jgi:8-oxo-dGTP pyrophosphatase MutT (NUDIX family)